jgi:hypothetical protein
MCFFRAKLERRRVFSLMWSSNSKFSLSFWPRKKFTNVSFANLTLLDLLKIWELTWQKRKSANWLRLKSISLKFDKRFNFS